MTTRNATLRASIFRLHILQTKNFATQNLSRDLKKKRKLPVHPSEVESRTQGSRPRPRTQKNFEAKDRPSRGHGQGLSTQAQVFSKKKKVCKQIFEAISNKRSSKIFFRRKRSSKIFFTDFHLRKTKKVFANFLRGFWRFPTKF